MGVYFQRQFASAVKLLSNLVRWQGVLSDTVLCEVALDSLLNRYLLSAVRICDIVEAATKCQMVCTFTFIVSVSLLCILKSKVKKNNLNNFYFKIHTQFQCVLINIYNQ